MFTEYLEAQWDDAPEDNDPLCQCQGCGKYEGVAKLGTWHTRKENFDGTILTVDCGEFC